MVQRADYKNQKHFPRITKDASVSPFRIWNKTLHLEIRVKTVKKNQASFNVFQQMETKNLEKRVEAASRIRLSKVQ